jgi:uncharacterized protein with GYD domain
MHFCITAGYTPKAMEAMAKNPNTNRRDAFEKLVKAAGGKVVGMYSTMGAVVASSDGVHNFKMVRLFTMEEVIEIRKKRIELQASYSPPDK